MLVVMAEFIVTWWLAAYVFLIVGTVGLAIFDTRRGKRLARIIAAVRLGLLWPLAVCSPGGRARLRKVFLHSEASWK